MGVWLESGVGMNLNHPDSPDVIQALETKCCVCKVPKGTYCSDTIITGRAQLPMGRLVHIGRATKEKS